MKNPKEFKFGNFKNKLPAALLAAGVVFFISGCDGSEDRADLKLFVDETKKLVKNKIDALPEEKAFVDTKYSGLYKRSPFVTPEAYIKSQVGSADSVNQPDIQRSKEVLEGYEINELKMVGSIKKNDGTYSALVKDTENKIYKVKSGNYIGQDFGEVLNVTEKDIEIEEKVSNGFGNWRTHTVIIKLQE